MISDVSDAKDIVYEAKNQESNTGSTKTFSHGNMTYVKGSELTWTLAIVWIVILFIMFCSGSFQKQKSITPKSAYTTNASAANVTPAPTRSANLTFEIPPIGNNNALNLPQLRWYFREKIRIETMRDLASNNKAIDEFNDMVDNFNSRCGSFRYERRLFAQAREEIDAIKDKIIDGAQKDAVIRGW